MTNEKDKALAHNAIDSVASSYRKSEKDGDLFVEARFSKLCTSFESVLATARKEEREAALNVALKTEWNASRSNIIEALEASLTEN